MAAEITLRPVTPSDREFLRRVYVGTRDDVQAVPWDDAQRRAFLDMQFEAQQTDYETRFPGAEHSIVLVDGVAHGRIWIDRRGDEIRLLDIALLPERRGHGTGRELLERLIAEARDAGLPLRHSVYKTNGAALRFYERLGFEVFEDYEMYVLMEWTGVSRRAG